MIELIPLVAFPLLRMLHGAGKISKYTQSGGMAIAVVVATGNVYMLALFPALLWAYSYGWSLSAINGQSAFMDWDKKFAPSGDMVSHFEGRIRNQYILGAIGWMPRIFMTFWAACTVAGNVWAVIPLALIWGWCYYLGGLIGRVVKRDIGTRIAEGLTSALLAVVLVY